MSRVRSVPSRSWQLASSACAIVAALALLFIPSAAPATSGDTVTA